MDINMDSVVYLDKKPRFIDERGYFSEVYNYADYCDKGIHDIFVQDNHSLSKSANTIRGLHFQAPPRAQAKLVRCIRGSIYDVIVDIRLGSPSYGRWRGFHLTEENGEELYVPVGFAHGFLTLEQGCEVVYKCSDYYAPQTEGSVLWNDPDICIDWPTSADPILSYKDTAAPLLSDLESPFVFGENS